MTMVSPFVIHPLGRGPEISVSSHVGGGTYRWWTFMSHPVPDVPRGT